MPKISELNPITNMSPDNLLMVVNDPNGAPSTNKITFRNFANSVSSYLVSGNVVFSNTTVSAAYRNQNLILEADHGNVVISSNTAYTWTFNESALILNSSSYGDIIGIGEGMGPTIVANGSLYTISYNVNLETNEFWEQGTLSYPGTVQLATNYQSDTYSKYAQIYMSSTTEQGISLYLSSEGPLQQREWFFDIDGKLTLPNQGTISDSFPIFKAEAASAYDNISWSGTTITFDNASSSILRDMLALLEVGDRISLNNNLTTVISPYTGGLNGSFTVSNDYSIAEVESFMLPDKRNYKEGITISNGGANTWVFAQNGDLILPGGQIIGGIDSTNGITLTTSRGTVLFGNQPENCVTQSSHFHIMPEDSSAIDLIFGDDTNYVKLPRGEDIVDISAGGNIWRFESDGSLSLPPNSQIGSESPFNITNAKTITANNVVISDNLYDDLYRPLFNTNALDINADGGTSISVFAVRDESFTGGGSRTVYGKYEAALDGGFSYNNRHSSNFIDGGGSNQI